MYIRREFVSFFLLSALTFLSLSLTAVSSEKEVENCRGAMPDSMPICESILAQTTTTTTTANYETGTVKWFSGVKGYGYISRDQDGGDIFVHRTAIRGDYKTLDVGERVSFKVVQSDKGLQAADVSVQQ